MPENSPAHPIKLIAQTLLDDNSQILFLPIFTRTQGDSHGEIYTSCDSPEAAIAINSQAMDFAVQISGGGPIEIPLLLHDNSPESQNDTRPLPRNFNENLADSYRYISDLPTNSPNPAADFTAWINSQIQSTRPPSRLHCLLFFLPQPEAWMIGLRPYSPTTAQLNDQPLNPTTPDEPQPWNWYSLPNLINNLEFRLRPSITG